MGVTNIQIAEEAGNYVNITRGNNVQILREKLQTCKCYFFRQRRVRLRFLRISKFAPVKNANTAAILHFYLHSLGELTKINLF